MDAMKLLNKSGEHLTAAERLAYAGHEDVVLLENYGYDDALIGVTTDCRAVYDFDKMVEWLMSKEGWTREEALDWVGYNTIRALGYAGQDCPIIMYPITT